MRVACAWLVQQQKRSDAIESYPWETLKPLFAATKLRLTGTS